ncbi:MAG: porin [Pseudomonadota bacterium]
MNIKRLVLGTAAGALAVTGAQAADLPVVVEPVDYVRICDAAGTGHFFVPGTETCMLIRTRVRTDYNLYFDFDDFEGESGGFYDGDIDDRLYRFRARGYVRTSTVTQTEFGQLTTFVDIFVTKDSAPRGNNGASAPAVELDSALIQLGGLILGRFATTFGGGQGIYTIEQTFDLGNNTGQVNQIAYQFDFGNGFLAQIAVEDNTEHRRSIAGPDVNAIFNTDYGNQDVRYGGAQIPDIVAKLVVDQGWGSAHVSAAGHYINGIAEYSDSNNFADIRVTDETYGFAVGAGVEVNVPFGNGTRIGVQGGYALGAQDYINDGMGFSFAGDLALVDGEAPDAVFDGNGNLEMGNFFAVAGGVTTAFTPTVSAALGAGYTYADYDIIGDQQNINVQGSVGWEPVSGLLFAVSGEYRYIDGNEDGSLLTTFLRAQADF